MKIQYFNRTRLSADLEQQSNATYCPTLAELLSTSDVISINTPLTPETNKMLGKKEFALMKDGVFIVNTGRGTVIDDEAFIDALESGKVARAGLDVFVGEPKIK
jgi:lactate dehydrogenase-like 2-hydroxyacid dehydrogenase